MAPTDLYAPLDALPCPVVITREQQVVFVNRTWETLFGKQRADVIGMSSADAIRGTIVKTDVPFVDSISTDMKKGLEVVQDFWLRIATASGEKLVNVRFKPGPGEGERTYLLLEANAEADFRLFTEGLISGTGKLLACRTEAEVLDAALDALAELGLHSTFLFFHGNLLHQGPHRQHPGIVADVEAAGIQIPVLAYPVDAFPHIGELLATRRGHFIQDLHQTVGSKIDPVLRAVFRKRFPVLRGFEVALFVKDSPYVMLSIQSPALSPAKAATLELFSQQVSTALATVTLQRELIHHERLAVLGEAAATLAHEIRHPVGVISNATALLRRAQSPEPELLGVLEEESARLDNLVNALLDFSRPIKPVRVLVALSELLGSAIASVRRGHESATIDFVIPDALVSAQLSTDPRLLQIAVENLLRNAVQASVPSGRVLLQVESRAEFLCLSVSDDGPGVSSDAVDHVFEPFFTTRAKGTGLGLSVVKRLAEALGGTVALRSPEGQGARFELLIPALP